MYKFPLASLPLKGMTMPTVKQSLGAFGEQIVAKTCVCPRCKRQRTLIRLPPNFKCADIICDFCGYLAQVKTATSSNVEVVPDTLMGAAWGPQKARMDAAIYFPLFVVLATADLKQSAIYYLSADLQPPELFVQRKPLSTKARRAGWVGFNYNAKLVHDRFVRLS
jgi:type II restriction enzyme